MKENRFLTLKLYQKKKRKIKKTKYQKHKSLKKEVLNNRLKSENKELRFQTLRIKQQGCKNVLQKTGKLCYYKAKTRKLKADKAKKY